MSRLALLIAVPLLLGQTQPPASWRQFASKDGAFTISAPGVPKEKHQKVKLESGAAEVSLFLWDAASELTLLVGVNTFPEAAVEGGEEKRLKNARDGAVEKAKGKLVHERKIALAGNPGREIWIETANDGMIHARLFAVKQRLYQTMAIGPKTSVETKEVAAFMDSFRVK